MELKCFEIRFDEQHFINYVIPRHAVVFANSAEEAENRVREYYTNRELHLVFRSTQEVLIQKESMVLS